MEYIYVGNLPENITKQDICELFGLNSTSYLRDTFDIDFRINDKTRKFKGFALISPPAHLTDELIKLDCIAYHDNVLRVKDTTSTRKRTSNTSNQSRRPSIVVNNHPKNQHLYGTNLQSLKANFQKEKKQIVVFGDSILCGIRLREFSYWLHKGYAQLKLFPSGTSKERLYYVETTLKNKKFVVALLHVGVNDLLNDESQDLKQIGLKYKSAGTVVNNKLTSAHMSSVN